MGSILAQPLHSEQEDLLIVLMIIIHSVWLVRVRLDNLCFISLGLAIHKVPDPIAESATARISLIVSRKIRCWFEEHIFC